MASMATGETPPGAPTTTSSTNPTTTSSGGKTPVGAAALLAHLERLLPALLDSPAGRPLFAPPAAAVHERLARFAADSQLQAIYVARGRPTGAMTATSRSEAQPSLPVGLETDDASNLFTLEHDAATARSRGARVALIKRVPVLEDARPLRDQLLVIDLPGETDGPDEFSVFHSYLQHAFSPFFESAACAALRDDKDTKMGLSLAKKKVAELELTLTQLQHSVAIPEIVLRVHAEIQRCVSDHRSLGSRPTVEALGATATDSAFLNRIQGNVNEWIRDIQKITHLDRDPQTGSARQEIEFWLALERALSQIEEQLRSDGVVLTLETLRTAKRFHATVSFIADTGIKEAIEKVQRYNQLMKDFPINELLASTELDKIREAIVMIFAHLSKKLKLSPYPIRRALLLVEAVSRDLNAQLLKVLSGRKLMQMPWDDFDACINQANEVFYTWDDLSKEFLSLARELTRKRLEKILPVKITPAHAALQERLSFVHVFRRQHEQLFTTILRVVRSEAQMQQQAQAKQSLVHPSSMDASQSVALTKNLGLGESGAQDNVRAAFESIRGVDVLDLSPEGTESWITAEKEYNDRIAQVESQIIARLRHRLAAAKNATDMFRVFSKFNALFIRPKIRGAIHEYQTQLIERVKDDIRRLHEKFIQQHSNSEALQMGRLRDLLPVSNAIIWARQIERQLGLYMRRVEDVLGKGWEQYAEGQKLSQEEVAFKRQLDARSMFDKWVSDVARREMNIGGRIFDIVRVRSRGAGANAVAAASSVGAHEYQLSINFDAQAIAVFKEVRNLLWLQFPIPHTIVSLAKDAKRVYPYAVSLNETVRTYVKTLNRIAEHDSIKLLVAQYHKDVQSLISTGIQLRWDYFINTYDARDFNGYGNENRHVVFVRNFALAVSLFQEKTTGVIAITESIGKLVDELETVMYEPQSFKRIMDGIQKLIDQLNIESYSNLSAWTDRLDTRIENMLLKRLRDALRVWTSGRFFEPVKGNFNGNKDPMDDTLAAHMPSTPARPLYHELQFRNQSIYLDPPLEYARMLWTDQLRAWLGIVTELERPRVFDMGLVDVQAAKASTQARSNYRKLATMLTDDELYSAHAVVAQMYTQAQDYVQRWLQYQSLWDLEQSVVYDALGDDLELWARTLVEVKKARSTFDTATTCKAMPGIVIDYEFIQIRVGAQYDQWQRELLNRYGAKLSSAMRDFHAEIVAARQELERSNVGSTTADMISFVISLQELRSKESVWANQVAVQQHGQKILERQRFHFPSDWLYFDQISGDWSALREILGRKSRIVDDQIVALRDRVREQALVTAKRMRDTLAEWDRNKPVQGDIRPSAAIATLERFEVQMKAVRGDFALLQRAEHALGMSLALKDLLEHASQELAELKLVYGALASIWATLEEIHDIPWFSDSAWTVRQRLEALMQQVRDMPSRMRQYSAYDHTQVHIRNSVQVHIQISRLKSEALRERHWTRILAALGLEGVPQANLTVGQLWNTVRSHERERQIDEILAVAQGEMALEEYLKQIRATWSNYSLEFTNYQSKCRLVKGWDELFTRSEEHLAALSAMRGSPYFKMFEDDAVAFEDKLTRLHILLELWIVVQRQWVYLEGIFSGNQDIRQILPLESNRFVSVDNEFMAMLRKVYKSPLIMDVIALPNIQKSMERLADMLNNIQKSLGEYLEKERVKFPRFYFVGDEDLLEILGNSKDLSRIQPHLKKMFAGIHSLSVLPGESQEIGGIFSKEGEEISLVQKVPISQTSRVHEWLDLLETESRRTLAHYLAKACHDGASDYHVKNVTPADLSTWIDVYPAQIILLASQIKWTTAVENALSESTSNTVLNALLTMTGGCIGHLARLVLTELSAIRRKKCEALITELVHQRDVIRMLVRIDASDASNFAWLSQMRYYFTPTEVDPLKALAVRIANASFFYAFEYQGILDHLVRTPLTDRCYLTLAQALHSRLGGSPFGPAGTGKTESVKAMGAQLGRHVLVFCCDENFDFQSMGRIFTGLCQVGAIGCFDEFNRLDERILSAVSQQIQTIQLGLRSRSEIELLGKSLTVHKNTGIFITMNPGYAGRSNLPDNLRKLFRSVSMTVPDRLLITQVMLFSQGFSQAELLASKVIPFFDICREQLSAKTHYDFGLRALKSVLVSAGNLQRSRLIAAPRGDISGDDTGAESCHEQAVLVRSIRETVFPKLVKSDTSLAESILGDVFPGMVRDDDAHSVLRTEILAASARRQLIATEPWLEKVVQLYNIQKIHHGIMIVGPSGSGKSAVREVLFEALEKTDGVDGQVYIIEPKSISKDKLYGSLDATTREWSDGVFTHILRRIIDDVRGESARRQWIVFDGDVDPEWVENLNSVLDDNRMLTLPNGERLRIPTNMRILFEVENLDQATPATISRCGMVWFSDDLVTSQMLADFYLSRLRSISVEEEVQGRQPRHIHLQPNAPEQQLQQQQQLHSLDSATSITGFNRVPEAQLAIADLLEPLFRAGDILDEALRHSSTLDCIMEISRAQALGSLFSLMDSSVKSILRYNSTHPDFPLSLDQLENFILRSFYINLVWSLAGGATFDARRTFAEYVTQRASVPIPARTGTVLDYDVDVASGTWTPWSATLPQIEIDPQNFSRADIVVPTVCTVRHEKILFSWLAEHRPVILCGPPGSGKTMTLLFALRKMAEIDVHPINFSSETSYEMILRVLELNCEYRKTSNGLILSPRDPERWLVLFCDEINLPRPDKYGTQRAIAFIRQIIEHGGFWRSDRSWVDVRRVQFVGACNPPTDPGRFSLSHRFLRHASIVFVDYPDQESLLTIYGTFARACLKVHPNLRDYASALTGAMVEFFVNTKRRFTPDVHAHYIYSPRELTRWIRGIYEIIHQADFVSIEGLVRAWAHEALRLYQDRLVGEEERVWTDAELENVAQRHFPGVNLETSLQRPILFSSFLSKDYVSVDRAELRDFVRARLQIFYEEELDIPLVLFDKALDHILRIDRVLRQPQGHMLVIGVSGAGKATLTRFVAWMNGMTVYEAGMHNNYSASDFDDSLRTVLRRSGCKGEKICFLISEGSIRNSGFLERMNTLLANAEIPGLFEADEFMSLMSACKESSQRDGLTLDTHDELYQWFRQQVMRNLHVVFTMNPPEGELSSKAATSPALFNRCVLDWFGDWDAQALLQVSQEFTNTLDLEDVGSTSTSALANAHPSTLPGVSAFRSAILDTFVIVHQSVMRVNERIVARQGSSIYVTPRQYLDFLSIFLEVYQEKRSELEERQRHLIVGLDRLRDTVVQVEELRTSLASKKLELEQKTEQANSKLQRMIEGQQASEQKRQASVEIQGALAQQKLEIENRRRVVVADLEMAEPAVVEAQQSVSNIKKQHLTEVRAMGNPPSAVKMAMESVCILLGHKVDSWKSVQAVLRRDDFISSIVNYDTNKLSRKVRDEIKSTYLEDPNFTFEVVNRASKACGPLVQWVVAQVTYSDILERVGPLREEVLQLENSAEETQTRAVEIEQMIKELEENIAVYKGEYAVLISQTQTLTHEMQVVKSRVERSMRVLDNLSSERGRWEESRESFGLQMQTLIGDVLLASAFIAYAGYYDQRDRLNLLHTWRGFLTNANIRFNATLSLPEYLSTAEERSAWIANALPSDNLCLENAVMLKRSQRYPLIIDPSSQALAFLAKEYRGRNISVTSFRDSAFLKTIESALRFGNAVLVQDVEDFDPILNSILNKELRRSGGRTLCRFGGREIDFSPSFTMFLSTRNPSLAFTPDVSSRVSFVNFNITPASLQLQCLDLILKAERPDVEAKRQDLVRVQGGFQLRLHHLEKALLTALNEAQGNILDNDNVINTLEILKQEASEIMAKVQETDVVMQEVEAVSSLYTPLADSCSAIYFAMSHLSTLESVYQFSLDFFLEIFDLVLKSDLGPERQRNKAARPGALELEMFRVTFERVSRSLRQSDILVFGILIAQIRLRATSGGLAEQDLEFLLGGGVGGGDGVQADATRSTNGKSVAAGTGAQRTRGVLSTETILGRPAAERISELARLRAFSGIEDIIVSNADTWEALILDAAPEEKVPVCWHTKTKKKIDANDPTAPFYSLLVIKCIRPDRLHDAMVNFVQKVFGSTLTIYSTEDKLARVIEETRGTTPIILCSDPGYDTSSRVEMLATQSGQKLIAVALGSAEGFQLADAAVATSLRTGTWVLLKNAHLSLAWLGQLEKRLRVLKPGSELRVFLTLEITAGLPLNLLRLSRSLLYEPPVGIKASITESLGSIPRQLVSSGPVEKFRLFFILAWLHAVILERLRYLPVGWTKFYDFNDSDFDMALHLVDAWLVDASQGRTNIPPSAIPWDALQRLISENVYGGKLDVSADQETLDVLVKEVFTPAIFERDFMLVQDDADASGNAIASPEGINLAQFVAWVRRLKDTLAPNSIGLPVRSDMLLKQTKALNMLAKMRQIHERLADVEEASESTGRANWTSLLRDSVEKWLGVLPTDAPRFSSSDRKAEPLARFFKNECDVAKHLLVMIRSDLDHLRNVFACDEQHTNSSRALASSLRRGDVPKHWKSYTVPASFSVVQFIDDLVKRLGQIKRLASEINLQAASVWIGGLFTPEAFVTATRQTAAKALGVSLESLKLDIAMDGSSDGVGKASSGGNGVSFSIIGLKIEGARWVDGRIELAAEVVPHALPPVRLRWVQDAAATPTSLSSTKSTRSAMVQLPVYLNPDRRRVLFSVSIMDNRASTIIKRSVAIIAL